jgi:hypothetical protein
MLSVTTVIEAPMMVVEDVRGGGVGMDVLTTKSEAEDDNGEENLIPEQEEFPKVEENEGIGINNIKREPSPPPMINNSPSRVRVSSFVPVAPTCRESVVSENNYPPRPNNPHIRTIGQFKPILVQPNNTNPPPPDYYDNHFIPGPPPLRPAFTPNDYFIPPDEESDPGVIVYNGRTSNYCEPTENNLVDVHGMYVDPRWAARMKQEERINNHYDVHPSHTYPDYEVYFPNKRMRIHQPGNNNNNSTPHQ